MNFTACSESKLIDVTYPEYPSKKLILDNGMTVIVSENHRIPFVAIELLVKVGSSLEEEFTSSGISHLVEHMLFKGTKKRPAGRIEEEIRSYGASINGFTSFDYTGYTISVPRQYLANTLELLSDVMENSTIFKDELEKEREVIVREIEMNYDEPPNRLSQLFYKNFFVRHTYRYPIIGEKALLKALTRNDVFIFYKRNYVPNNMIVAISGDIAADKAEEMLKLTLGKLKPYPVKSIVLAQEPDQAVPVYIEQDYEGNLTYLLMGFHSVCISEYDLYALDLLAHILGGTTMSRLYKVLYDRKKLVYSINAYNYTPKHAGIFSIHAVVKNNEQKKVIDSIFDEINRMQGGDISPEEIILAKNNILAGYRSNLETIQSQAADSVTSEALTDNFEFSKSYIEKIKKVNKKDLQYVAKKYLNRNNVTVTLLKPRSVSLKEKKPESGNYKEETGKVTLENGLRLVYCKRKDLPKANITVVLKGGLLSETETTNGLSNISAHMLLKGTQFKDAKCIQNIIESAGGEIGAFSGNGSFGFTIEIPDVYVYDALNLVSELLTSATFPKEELEKEKLLIKAEIERRNEDIFAVTLLKVKQLLFRGCPYSLDPLGSSTFIEQVKREDLINFYKAFVAANNTVISVTGNINEQRCIALIKNKLSALRQKTIVLHDKESPVTQEALFSSQTMPKKEAVIMVGYKAPPLSSKDRYIFEIIASVLSGEDGRLFKEIRQKRGFSYTQDAVYIPAFINGYFIIYASVEKNNIDTVKTLIFNELKKIKTRDLTGKEFMTAKNKLLSEYWLGLQSNSGLSFQMATDELYGLGFDHYTSYTADVHSVAIPEIQKVLNKYIDTDACVVSVTLPETSQ
ncbi:MAG: pitrilysin family protein [Candidatus Omnitrophota bacterium]